MTPSGHGTFTTFDVLTLKADMPVAELIEQLQHIQRQKADATIPFQDIWQKERVQIVDARKMRVPIVIDQVRPGVRP